MLKLIKTILPQRFGNYWKQIKNKNNFNKDLINFTEKFIKSNSYKFVSNQWHLLNISDYKSIKDHGLDKYGSHISTHYFTFMNKKVTHKKQMGQIKMVLTFNKHTG